MIEPVESALRGASQTTPEETTASAASSASADFESFLRLLTTQLRNQDPLQPLDSTEFVAQLASFSAVEQQINSNKKLDGILAAMTESRFDRAVQWIGKDVELPLSEFRYDGSGSVTFQAEAPEAADAGRLTVRSLDGKVVAEIPLSAETGRQSVAWDGRNKDGEQAGAGDYEASIIWQANGIDLETTAPLMRIPVREVSFDGEDLLIVADGGQKVSVDQVSAVMERDAPASLDDEQSESSPTE